MRCKLERHLSRILHDRQGTDPRPVSPFGKGLAAASVSSFSSGPARARDHHRQSSPTFRLIGEIAPPDAMLRVLLHVAGHLPKAALLNCRRNSGHAAPRERSALQSLIWKFFWVKARNSRESCGRNVTCASRRGSPSPLSSWLAVQRLWPCGSAVLGDEGSHMVIVPVACDATDPAGRIAPRRSHTTSSLLCRQNTSEAASAMPVTARRKVAKERVSVALSGWCHDAT